MPWTATIYGTASPVSLVYAWRYVQSCKLRRCGAWKHVSKCEPGDLRAYPRTGNRGISLLGDQAGLRRRASTLQGTAMQTAVPIVKDVVLVGGGHSHVAVLKSFGMKPIPGVRLSLITKEVHTPYSGMLPGFVAGEYTFDECHLDLFLLATFAGARFIHAEAVGFNLQERRVLMKGRPPLPYDVLSIDVGISPGTGGIPGVSQHATPVKPVSNFVERFQRLRDRVLLLERPCQVVVVGGGAGGVEMAFCLHRALSDLCPALPPSICLLTRGKILASAPSSARVIALRIMKEKGMQVREEIEVAEVREEEAVLRGGETIPFDECVWCTGAAAPSWLPATGLPLDAEGFISIDATLQCDGGPPGVFAVGDVATSAVDPRPKAGVFAVRQGPPLADNIRRYLRGDALREFKPQSTYLSILTTGDRYAIATKGWLCLEGAWVWRWKDYIDRTWMAGYGAKVQQMMADEHVMKPEAALVPTGSREDLAVLAAAKMRCTGCGGKVGSSILSAALERLGAERWHADLVVGLAAPDDAAVVRPPAPGHLLLQTLDFLRSFISDPYVFGAVAANHALGDCQAMGGRPRTALAIVALPYAAASKVEDDLFQLLAGAASVLEPVGCALAGGHTAEAQDLLLGFSVEGVVKEDQLLRKEGMRPGQAIILTKPLGTGVLLAAAMRGAARGRWITGALASMQQSSQGAVAAVQKAGASAATDVTGFGLLGHLLEMLRASKVGARLTLDSIPLLDGALECTQQGIFSSIYPDNARAAADVSNLSVASTHATWPLLFDPQTGGGLLASVPLDKVDMCLQLLAKEGFAAASVIGEVQHLEHGAKAVSFV